jgi:2-oxoisovalerate dehydrogenase E1 component
MRELDVSPCHDERGALKIPDITLYRYDPDLKDELEKGLIDREGALRLFRYMITQRAFEYTIRDLDNKNFVPCEGFEFRGSTHLSVGQEAAQTGAIAGLTRNDYIAVHHRAHGHCIAKGLFAYLEMSDRELRGILAGAEENEFDVSGYDDIYEAAYDYHMYRMIAEALGMQAGYCRGRGGAMHIADFSVGHLGANAIVGGGTPIATGAALGVANLGEERVVLCAIGDGAMNNGVVHESFNFATMAQFEKGLPVIYFVENNQYGMTGQQKGEVTDINYMSQRGAGYNDVALHAETICGMNVLTVREAVSRARDLCLKGEGPVLIEANTYRFWGHNFKDKGTAYRSNTETDAWRKHDPVEWFRAELIGNGIMKESEAEELWEGTREKLKELTVMATKGRFPEISDMEWGLYADTTTDNIGEEFKTKKTYKKFRRIKRDSEGLLLGRHAVAEALYEEMLRDRRVVLWGEDIAAYGGAYNATLGLFDTFGKNRIFNTPISEATIIGTGVGAAMVGLRPVVELMYIDFILMAMDQVGNQAAKTRYMFGGQSDIPVTIRTTIGGGKGYAGQHAQSLESIVTQFPGLKVAIPSNPTDLKGLLKTAIRDDNPVCVIEHQWVYLEKSEVPEDENFTIPFGEARVVREGKDITIVTYSQMVNIAKIAAENLAEEGIDVEIVDPRTLVPLDIDTIAKSVKKTGRAVVVTQAPYTGGFASHISHEITSHCFQELKCPVRILAGYDVPPPMSHPLEVENMPNPERIARGVKETLAGGVRETVA